MDLTIKNIDNKIHEDGSVLSTHEIEPLERGFGITLGNTFRRICLSHLEGTSVTSVRIEGITHEFSTIKGVAEDVVEIILNLKSLVFKTDLKETFTAEINFTGPGEIKGKDLQLPAGIEIVNQEQIIATVTDSVEFKAEITGRSGRGYVLA
ncbi:MAG TPA: DNA-directed RNA polymerase subunit alpha, partial [Vampirovibrionales bacterium]